MQEAPPAPAQEEQAQERAIKAAQLAQAAFRRQAAQQKQAAEQKQAAQSLIANNQLSDTSSEEDNQRLALLQPAPAEQPLRIRDSDSDTSNGLDIVSAQQPEQLILTDSQKQTYNLIKSKIDNLLDPLNPLNPLEKDAKKKITTIKSKFDYLNIDNTNIINELKEIDNIAKDICRDKDLTTKNLKPHIENLCEIRKLLKNFMKSFKF